MIEANNLAISESALTGEGLPTEKTASPALPEVSLGDRKCLGCSGTLVTAGSGFGVVVETGDRSEIGRINAILNQTEDIDTPLVKRLSAFSNLYYRFLGI